MKKKVKSNSKKDVTKKKATKAASSRPEKKWKTSVGKSEQRDRKRKEKRITAKVTNDIRRKNNSRKGTRRTEKDAELELLNKLFLKELEKPKRKASKQTLKFERKPNKENKRKRGNAFVIIFPSRSTFQQKVNLINAWDGKELKYYVDRFSKLPQAIQVILTTKKGSNTFERATKISPFDFVVNVPNTKLFILEMMISFQDNYIEYVENDEPLDSDWVYDPSKIIKVTVRFIY